MDVQIDNVSNMPTNYDYMNNIGTNPWSLIFLSGVILVYYLIFAALGSGTSGGDEGGQSSIKSFIFTGKVLSFFSNWILDSRHAEWNFISSL